MAATSVYTFASGDYGVPLDAEYTSQSINKAFGAARGVGVVRGFRVVPSASNSQVDVKVDRWTGDSVAFWRTAAGEAVWARREVDFALDLTAHEGDTVVLALHGVYTTVLATTMEIKAYPISEWEAHADKPTAIPLALVVVPTPAALVTVTTAYRKEAWESEVVGWAPLVGNPNFSVVRRQEADELADWFRSSVAGSTWTLETVEYETGIYSLKSVTTGSVGWADLEVGSDGIGASYFAVTTKTPLLVRLRTKPVGVTDYVCTARIRYYDKDGAILSQEYVTVPSTGGWATTEKILDPPVSADHVKLAVNFQSSGTSVGTYYVDSFQVFRGRLRESALGREADPYLVKGVGGLLLADHAQKERFLLTAQAGMRIERVGNDPAASGLYIGNSATGKELPVTLENAATLKDTLQVLSSLWADGLLRVLGTTTLRGNVVVGDIAGVDMQFHALSKILGRVQISGGLDKNVAPDNNRQLGESNLIRAWGIVGLNGLNVPTTKINGYNFAQCSGLNNVFSVTFHTPLPAPSNIAPFALHSGGNVSTVDTGGATKDGFDFSCIDQSGSIISGPTGYVYWMILANDT